MLTDRALYFLIDHRDFDVQIVGHVSLVGAIQTCNAAGRMEAAAQIEGFWTFSELFNRSTSTYLLQPLAPTI